ncbi:MAG: hypothetical protein FWH53_01830 [Leptospirales bacterium]|nr:hypothetical protein [Leptospirales bacterium]
MFSACGGGGSDNAEISDIAINIKAIQGVTPPAFGETPVTNIENEQYTGVVEWSPAVSGTFADSTIYTATITMTPKYDYTLEGVAADFFTVAGATSVNNNANSGVIIAVFPTTGTTASTTVNIAAIQGITAPASGKQPITTITETAQYTGTVTWSPTVVGTFAPSTEYTATIFLTAKPGYTLQGVAANFFTVAGAISVSNSADLGVITAIFQTTGSTGATVINIATIQGVTTPAYGETPVTTITETTQYTGTVTWSPTVPGTFAASTDYTAIIILTPKSGYTLQGVGDNFFTVTGAISVNNSANSGVIIAVFPTTETIIIPPTVINIAAIQGVTVPVTGVTRITAITETTQYTGTVTWSPTVISTFAPSTVYTATITLTSKTGYTLEGVGANFFTVAGATTVSNLANSGVITAVFPATEDAVINIAAIQGVTVPVTGETRITAITETTQYTGTVTWSPNDTTFAPTTMYTATITLTPRSGYTLQSVGANFFTVAGATTVSNSANSGVITAVFPTTGATAPTTVNISAIQGVTVPVTGATRVTAITETTQYTGTVTWSPNDTTFAPTTMYTATITLIPKTGYTLEGVGVNFFTVAGATSVSNNANSGVITAVFPPTEAIIIPPTVINIAAIQGVTVPVTGATRITAITETTQYTGTVTWSPNDTTFAPTTVYTATITLTPKTDYTLQGVGTNFFTIAGATSVSNNANSGVITAVFPKTVISSASWGSRAVAGDKVVMGRGNNGTSILIVDTTTGTVTEKGGLSSAYWGLNSSTAVAGDKVVMGRGGSSPGTSILIVDTTTGTVTEKGGLSSTSWGSGSIAVAGDKVVMGGSTSILIVDTTTGDVTEKGGLSSAQWGGYNSTAVAGDKVVMGRGNNGTSILIVDTTTGTVTEKGGLSSTRWGYNSTAVAGDKVVMGPGGYSGTSILIVDTTTGTVTEKGGLSSTSWGYNSTAVAGDKVVMGPGGYANTVTSILIVDTTTGTVTEKGGLFYASGYCSTAVAGDKVVMGRGDFSGTSILIVDTTTGTVTVKGGLSTSTNWGYYSTAVAGDKVVMGPGDIWTSTSILIVDTATGTVTVKGGLSSNFWGYLSTAVAGDKVVMGPDYNSGSSILIVDTTTGTVTEKGGLSSANWGNQSTAVAGDKVVMGRGNSGTSILIVDTTTGTVTEKGGLSSANWGSTAVAGDKVVMGPGSSGSSILIVDTTTGTVTELK